MTPIGFVAEAFSRFQFLLERGYRCSKQLEGNIALSESFVQFDASRLFIRVYLENFSGYCGVIFGKLDSPEVVYDMKRLLSFVDPAAAAGYEQPLVFFDSALQKALESEKDYLLRFGQQIIDDDVMFFERLSDFVLARDMTEFRDRSQGQAELFARFYWKKKNFFRVAFFLSPYKTALPVQFRKMLEQALEQLTDEERAFVGTFR